MKKITVTWLVANAACQEQVIKFKKVFGKEAKITPANLKKAAKHRLALEWVVIQSAPMKRKLTDMLRERDMEGHMDPGGSTCRKCARVKPPIVRKILLASAKG